ncbi:MAG: hypothetical protein AB7T27_02370 [Kiritimatiellia bacterium]
MVKYIYEPRMDEINANLKYLAQRRSDAEKDRNHEDHEDGKKMRLRAGKSQKTLKNGQKQLKNDKKCSKIA